MPEPIDPLDPIPSVVEVRDELPTVIEVSVPRGHPVIAWFFILLIVGGIVFAANHRPSALKGPESKDNAQLIVQELQARYLVGATRLVGKSDPSLMQNARMLDIGPLPQRLRFVALVGELSGPQEAGQQLQKVERILEQGGTPPSANQAAIMEILRRLYADYQQGQMDAPSVSTEDRRLLRDELEWFGSLALAPKEGPNPDERDQLLQG